MKKDNSKIKNLKPDFFKSYVNYVFVFYTFVIMLCCVLLVAFYRL